MMKNKFTYQCHLHTVSSCYIYVIILVEKRNSVNLRNLLYRLNHVQGTKFSPQKVAERVNIKKQNSYQHDDQNIYLPMPFAHSLLVLYICNNFSGKTQFCQFALSPYLLNHVQGTLIQSPKGR